MILNNLAVELTKGQNFKEVQKQIGQGLVKIEGIAPSSFGLLIATHYLARPQKMIVVTKNNLALNELHLDLLSFIDSEKICILPDWEVLPYENVSPAEKTLRTTISSYYKILEDKNIIVLTTVESFLRCIPQKDTLLTKGFELEKGQEYPFSKLTENLVNYGYERVSRVDDFGQFSIKGSLIDFFPPNSENPIRLDFFDEELINIKEFDINSQISINKLKSFTIYPRKGIILNEKDRENLLKKCQNPFNKNLELPQEIETSIKEKKPLANKINGIENLFPLIYQTETIIDFFKKKPEIILLNPIDLITQKDNLQKIFEEYYSRKCENSFCLPPEQLFRPKVLEEVKGNSLILQTITNSEDALFLPLRSIPHFNGQIKHVREQISERLAAGWRIIISTNFEGQARRLKDMFKKFDRGNEFTKYEASKNFNIIISPLKQGIEIEDQKILILTDNEIFGKSYKRKKTFKNKTSKPIDSFLDLKPGDYIVHINHGIGLFKGIERMKANDVERDFLILEYYGNDKLYVPLDQLNLVQKYIGVEGRKPRLDSLGKNSSWKKVKEKVQKAVEEIAQELIEIYSKRQALKGYSFPPDTGWQEEFESKFEYDETPDQITAIEDVKNDMESEQPMDRLICGDVGFGKTEVAIRAAFKATIAGKQVAILVPTTVLAMQHYSNFKSRFADYPIELEMISRFKTAKEIAKTKERLSSGETDVVIGTHALLAKNINFKNLGLLIIDEEQRFGVKHKESLKRFRSTIDVLTMSATPIPRTLHMSLAGMRNLSLITTPPENRQSVETYVIEDNPNILKMAIKRELDREGQIFYVHNRVETIEVQAAILQELVPEARICIAHGQMKEHELEQVMLDFLNFRYDILLCTTIIESGLDMPRVNTIIINRADTFGLSQLHQLKGRVGRSGIHAYAYLFYPKHKALSETAEKRLKVISEYSDLGSGFKIAMKDLEIRGAGNILGKEQSGTIMEVGFELYCQMLEEAIERLRGEDNSAHFRTPVNLKTDFYIPTEYISDEKQKIEFYKRFESCQFIEEVDRLADEMKDRFGTTPKVVEILIELERIRALASHLRIKEISEKNNIIKIRLDQKNRVNLEKLVDTIAKDKRISIAANDPELINFEQKITDTEKKLIEVKKWLQQII